MAGGMVAGGMVAGGMVVGNTNPRVLTFARSSRRISGAICRVLSWSSLRPDTNSRSRSAPAIAALRRAWRRPTDSITTSPAARSFGDVVGQPEQGHRVA
jgi:hypothetical protein